MANVTTINNSGAISSTGSHGIYFYNGSVTNFINTGTISGGGANSGVKIGGSYNTGVTNFTNTGTISSTGVGYGILANPVSGTIGTISTFNNGQGGDGTTAAKTALTYYGKLPTSYNIIVKSLSQYGQLAVTSPMAYQTTFGIYSGGVSGIAASVLSAGTYSSVLTGLTSSNITGSTSGAYDSYNWSLINSSGTTWDLVVTPSITNITTGSRVHLDAVGITAYPVFAGGTLALVDGQRSTQALSVQSEGGTIAAPTTGTAQLTGAITGSGRLTFNGTGMTVLSGANTYTGGTSVESGTLSLLGGTLGSGEVYVAPGARLMGTGSIAGPVTVAGLFKPGNSPGYIAASSDVVMATGSVYQQDIAGTTQSSASSPVGATGYYSYLNITGGRFIINSGSTLTPALSNLFSAQESGYGSTPYNPVIGDRFRIVTADGGISGKFSSVTQPTELTSDTQFLPFYNMGGSNSIDLAVIPKSYVTTIAANSGNKNAQSVGSALDKMVAANQTGVSTPLQDQLLYAASTQTASGLQSYAQSLAGEVYAAAVPVIAQATQRVQHAVLARLGDNMGAGLVNPMIPPVGNTSWTARSHATSSGEAPSAAVNTNPNVDPKAEYETLLNKDAWGSLVYQSGHRSSDSASGGWNSHLYQLVFGSDFYVADDIKVGGGFALSSTRLNPDYGAGLIHQSAVFAYSKMPVQEYVMDAVASVGVNSSDLSRGDITGLSNGFRNKSVAGHDGMVSLGMGRPVDVGDSRITPFARVTWQIVSQSAVNEGDAASALSVNRYTGRGIRSIIGVAAGSQAMNPTTDTYTYKAYAGIGKDSSGVLNTSLSASLAGTGTNIQTPNSGFTFVQAGLYGMAKVSNNTYVLAELSGETRSGQTLGAINIGVRVQF